MTKTKFLKTFVKMHEYKFEAKVHRLQAARLGAEIADLEDEQVNSPELSAVDNWLLYHELTRVQRKPGKKYLQFIATAPR